MASKGCAIGASAGGGGAEEAAGRPRRDEAAVPATTLRQMAGEAIL